MADYWLKLYTDILDDPKMGTLPDRIWRRTIELFLIAKKQGTDGELPETKQIAWLLRLPEKEVETDLLEIEKTGIIERTECGWFVVKFAKRQAASTDAERKARQRDRERKEQYSGVCRDDVTNCDDYLSRSVRQSRAEIEQSRAEARARVREETPKNQENQENADDPVFDAMADAISICIGRPLVPNDVPVIDEFIRVGQIPEDMHEATAYLVGVGKPPRSPTALRGAAQTAMNIRLGINGKNGKVKPSQDLSGYEVL